MSNTFICRFLFILIFFIAQGCAVYNSQVIPPVQISDPGEVQVDLGFSFADFVFSPGVHFSGAYGLSKNMYTQIFGSYIASQKYFGEGAFGWYNIKNKSRLDVLLGYFYSWGYSNNSEWFSENTIEWEGDYQSPFVKFQYTHLYSQESAYGVGLETGLFIPQIDERNIFFTYDDVNPDGKEERSQRYHNDYGLLFEPNIFFRFQLIPQFSVLFNASFSLIAPLDKNPNTNFNYYPIHYNGYGNFSMGFTYYFNLKK